MRCNKAQEITGQCCPLTFVCYNSDLVVVITCLVGVFVKQCMEDEFGSLKLEFIYLCMKYRSNIDDKKGDSNVVSMKVLF